MSKAVTNEEVEDVLSSIRRLVSEDKRPLAGFRSAAAEPSVSEPENAPEMAEPDRLVLTPALRVAAADDLPDAPQAISEDVAEDEEPLDLGSVARETWADAEDEEAADKAEPLILVQSENDDEDADMLDALVQDTLETEARAQTEELEDTDALVDGDYGDEGYWDVEEDPRHEEIAHDLEPEEIAETAQIDWAMDREDVRPTVDDMDEDGTAAEDNTAEDTIADKTTAEDIDETPFLAPKADVAKAPPASTIPLTAKIAALEAAVGEIANEWEPDGDEMDAMAAASAAPAMAWEDDVELDAKGAPIENPEPQSASKTAEAQEIPAQEAVEERSQVAGAFGGDDQLMDEEALRDLVGEIVRAELQGALGERITRNVRKLVRREIHRALTAQEME